MEQFVTVGCPIYLLLDLQPILSELLNFLTNSKHAWAFAVSSKRIKASVERHLKDFALSHNIYSDRLIIEMDNNFTPNACLSKISVQACSGFAIGSFTRNTPRDDYSILTTININYPKRISNSIQVNYSFILLGYNYALSNYFRVDENSNKKSFEAAQSDEGSYHNVNISETTRKMNKIVGVVGFIDRPTTDIRNKHVILVKSISGNVSAINSQIFINLVVEFLAPTPEKMKLFSLQ